MAPTEFVLDFIDFKCFVFQMFAGSKDFVGLVLFGTPGMYMRNAIVPCTMQILTLFIIRS